MKKLFVLISAIFLSISNSFGWFYSYGTFPTNPTEADTINIVFHTTTTSYPGGFFNHIAALRGDTVHVKSCWWAGQMDWGIDVFDTIKVGTLPAGNYSVGIGFYQGHPLDTSLNYYTLIDSIFFQFTVQELTHVNSLFSTTDYLISNSESVFTITTTEPTPNTTLQLLSIEGKQIITIPLTQSTQSIDISTLPPGLYFAVLQNEQGRVVRKFVKAAP